MNLEPRVDILASVLGDRSRYGVISALMDGRAYTAKELAWRIQVSAQTASFHLQRLSDAGLIKCHRRGRNRYYYLAGPEVAETVEAMMLLAPDDHIRRLPAKTTRSMSAARCCYNHLAGKLGVAVAERLFEGDLLIADGEQFDLTEKGYHLFEDLGVDLSPGSRGRKPLVRTCLDWTERRSHLSGVLGILLLQFFLADGWVIRFPGSRALALSPTGQIQFRKVFGIDDVILEQCEAAPQEACTEEVDPYDALAPHSKAPLQPPACIATMDLELSS